MRSCGCDDYIPFSLFSVLVGVHVVCVEIWFGELLLLLLLLLCLLLLCLLGRLLDENLKQACDSRLHQSWVHLGGWTACCVLL